MLAAGAVGAGAVGDFSGMDGGTVSVGQIEMAETVEF